jgi:hypothetical protein
MHFIHMHIIFSKHFLFLSNLHSCTNLNL